MKTILIILLLMIPLISAIGIDLSNEVDTALNKTGFDNPIIKEVDCNTGLISTKCFIMTNGKQSYNLLNLNVMTCLRPEMKRESVSLTKTIKGKNVLINSIRYRKTGKCLQYGELSRSSVTNVLTSVAGKKLVEISGVKPIITNPPKTYQDIQLTTSSKGGDELI